jgi:hypothetical protein
VPTLDNPSIFSKGNTGEVGESAAVLAGTTMASTVSLSRPSVGEVQMIEDISEECRMKSLVAATCVP